MTTKIYNWYMTLKIFVHFNSKINFYEEPCWSRDLFRNIASLFLNMKSMNFY